MPPAPTSAIIDSNLSSHIYNHLRIQSPTRTGLSLFALLVILRICVRRAASRLLPARSAPSRADTTTPKRTTSQPHSPPAYESHEDEPYPDSPPPPYQQHQTHPLPAMSDRGFRSMAPPPPPGSHPIPGQQPHYTLTSRPPPAPPLTPPELSSSVFSIDERMRQQHDNFMRQPNPDYAANLMADGFDDYSEPEPKHEAESRPRATPPTQPRRLSYNKTIAVGSPQPQHRSTYPGFFSPFRGSYPPAGTLSRGGPDGPDGPGPREIDVHGEIISMLDKNGTGWTRHTRVYGGGGCHTCPPTPTHRPADQGFYAPIPEEMR